MRPSGVAAAVMLLVISFLWFQEPSLACCTVDCMPVIAIEGHQPARLPDTVVIGCPLPGCYPLEVNSNDELSVEILYEGKNLKVEVVFDEVNLSGSVLPSQEGTPESLDEGMKTSWSFDPAPTNAVPVVSFQVSDSGLGEVPVPLTLEVSQYLQSQLIAKEVFSYVVETDAVNSGAPVSGEESSIAIENNFDKDLAVALVTTSENGVYQPYQLYRGHESFAISCPDPPCPQDKTRVAVLSDQNALFFSEYSSWPFDDGPPLEITLPEVEVVDLYLWVSAEELDATSHSSECRSNGAPAKDLHQNVKKALCHTALANVLLDEAHLGIRFNPKCTKVISEGFVEAVRKSWCGNGTEPLAQRLQEKHLFNADTLNVYYASIMETGARCASQPERVFIGNVAYPTSLAHEVGHSFGLQHPGDEFARGAASKECFAAANLMKPGTLERSCLTQGQTFRSVLGVDSSLNRLELRDPVGNGPGSLECGTAGQCVDLCVDIGREVVAGKPAQIDSDDLLSWFESESCLEHESLAPFVNNDEQFPRLLDFLGTVLNEGPSISRLALVKQDLNRNYTRVENHPEYRTSCPCGRDEYVDLHLQSFARLYQVRASQALGVQGGNKAWKILAMALSTGENSIPIDVKESIFEILESARNEPENWRQGDEWLAQASTNPGTPDEIKTKIDQLLGND